MTSNQSLEGITVIDCSQILAGLSAPCFLQIMVQE